MPLTTPLTRLSRQGHFGTMSNNERPHSSVRTGSRSYSYRQNSVETRHGQSPWDPGLPRATRDEPRTSPPPIPSSDPLLHDLDGPQDQSNSNSIPSIIARRWASEPESVREAYITAEQELAEELEVERILMVSERLHTRSGYN